MTTGIKRILPSKIQLVDIEVSDNQKCNYHQITEQTLHLMISYFKRETCHTVVERDIIFTKNRDCAEFCISSQGQYGWHVSFLSYFTELEFLLYTPVSIAITA